MEKIFITGTSGIGKTTLAEFIAKRYRIPFIEGSAKMLWGKYGIKSHIELLNMAYTNKANLLEFQYELLDIRLKMISENKSFVSDRSIIDNAVYFLLQNSPYLTETETQHYLDTCASNMSLIKETKPKFIYLSSNLIDKNNFVLENDGKRIDNNLFQNCVVSPIFEKVIKEDILNLGFNDKNLKVIRHYDWESRIESVSGFLENRNIIDMDKIKLPKCLKNSLKFLSQQGNLFF